MGRRQVSQGYGRGSKKLGVPTANLPESQFAENLRSLPTGETKTRVITFDLFSFLQTKACCFRTTSDGKGGAARFGIAEKPVRG